MDAVTEGHLVLDRATGVYIHPSELLCEGCGTGYMSDDDEPEIMFDEVTPEASWNCRSCSNGIFLAECHLPSDFTFPPFEDDC